MRRLALALIVLLIPSFAHAIVRTTPMRRAQLPDMTQRNNGDPGLPSVMSRWDGGESSLPYNVPGLSWQQIVSHAEQMSGTRLVENEFQALGYIRRADEDTAYSQDGGSVAVLAYQKPGVDMMVEQPVIIVTSFATPYYPGGAETWYPMSTIRGLVAKDSVSAGLHIPALVAGSVIPVVATERPVDGASPEQLQHPEAIRACFSGGEYIQNALAFIPHSYDGTSSIEFLVAQERWEQNFQTNIQWGTLDGMVAGALGSRVFGGPGMLIGAAWGAAAGAAHAAIDYVRNHPYPR